MRFEIGGKSSEIFTVEQKQRHVKRYARKRKGKTVRFNRKDETKFDEERKSPRKEKIECNANLIQSVEKTGTSAFRSFG